MAIFAAITVALLSATGLDLSGAGWLVALCGLVAWQVTNQVVGAPTR